MLADESEIVPEAVEVAAQATELLQDFVRALLDAQSA